MPDARFKNPLEEPDISPVRDLFGMSLAERAVHWGELERRYADMRAQGTDLDSPWREVELLAFDSLVIAMEIHQVAYGLIAKLEKEAPKAPLRLVAEVKGFTSKLDACKTAISQTAREMFRVCRSHRGMSPRDVEAASGLDESSVDYILSKKSSRSKDPRDDPGWMAMLTDMDAKYYYNLTEGLGRTLVASTYTAHVLASEEPGAVRNDTPVRDLFQGLQYGRHVCADIELSFVDILRQHRYPWDPIGEMFHLSSGEGARRRYKERLDEPSMRSLLYMINTFSADEE